MKQAWTLLVVLVICGAGPLLADPPDGRALYATKCAVCHGKDGTPNAMAKGSAAFTDSAWQQATTPEAVEKVVLEGKNKMTPFAGKLTPEEIRAIAAFVKTLK